MKKQGNENYNFKVLEQLLRDLKLPPPVEEHFFHPKRKWRFDYAWPAHKIALEVEGGIWRKGGGAHSRPSAIMRDIEKYNSATLLGWKIYRCTPSNLFSKETIQDLKTLLTI
jgi:hypothetical protein